MAVESGSVEARLDTLEAQHRNMDAGVHGLARVCADIKNIALTNQHDIAGLKASVATLAEATHSGFKRTDEKIEHLESRFDKFETRFDQLETRFDRFDTRFSQLELLIRQSLSSN